MYPPSSKTLAQQFVRNNFQREIYLCNAILQQSGIKKFLSLQLFQNLNMKLLYNYFFRKNPVTTEIVPSPILPPPPKTTTYNTNMNCKNCGRWRTITIEKGKTEEEYINENKNEKCQYCECNFY